MTVPIVELAAQLDSHDPATRRRAAEQLSQHTESAGDAATALVKHAGDDDRIVAEYCVATLEELGPPPTHQMSELAGLAASGNGDVTYWAITLIGRVGAAAAEQTPLLAQIVSGAGNPAVRQRAAWALGQIGPAAAAAGPQLEAATCDTSPGVARAAKSALSSIRG